MNLDRESIRPSPRKFLATAALCVATLVFQSTSRAEVYTFTWIAGSAGSFNDFGLASINRDGDVLFPASFDTGGGGLFVGNGGPPDSIIETGGTDFIISGQSINDAGDVAFVGESALDDVVVLRYNADDGTFTEIAETGDTFGDVTIVNLLGSNTAINNDGEVAFDGVHEANGELLRMVIMGTGLGPVVVASSESSVFEGLVSNVAGPSFEVAYREKLGPSSTDGARIVKGNVFSKTTIVDITPPFAPSTDFTKYLPSLIHSAVVNGFVDAFSDVAFSAPLTNGVNGVFIGDGVSMPTTIVDSGGGFDDFFRVSLGRNHIVFEARLDFTDTFGIYTGPSPTADKVLQEGDSVAGYAGTVNFLDITPRSVNNNGQIAIRTLFSNGRNRILRADPVGSYTALDDLSLDLTVAAMAGFQGVSMQQLVDVPQGRGVLAFDYLFATTTGVLEVWLGETRLATVNAPRRLASRFRMFRRPVHPLAWRNALRNGARSAPLEFRLVGGGEEAGVLVDNVVFPGVENGDFGTGDLSGWRTQVSDGGRVGVAYAPGDPVVRGRGCRHDPRSSSMSIDEADEGLARKCARR